jgi:ArsR family transcriptional regulator
MSMSAVTPIACCAPLTGELLTDDEAEATAAVFRALGDPARVRILSLLAASERPVCVCELIEPVGLAQPTVSHHLKKLVDAGLLDRAARGRWAYYAINQEAAARLAGLLDLEGAVR